MHFSKKDAMVLAIIYFSFGVLWILASDWLVMQISEDMTNFVYFSLIKGLLFVVLSSIVIYITLHIQQKKRARIESDYDTFVESAEEFQTLLENQKELLHNLIDESPVAMILHSENRKILRVSKNFTELTGYTIDDVPTLRALSEACWPYKSEEVLNHFISLYDMREKIYSGAFTLRTSHGNTLIWDLYSAYIGRDDSGLKTIITVGIDVTTKRTKEKDLTFKSYHDDLTGLYNRRYYNEMIPHFEQFKDIGVIVADINGLKLINDLFGHEHGDELLVTFAKILRNTLPKDAFIARLGGDEFLMVLYDYHTQDVEALVKSIKTSVQTNVINDIVPSVSFGIAKNQEEEAFRATFSRAENMLYRDKVHAYDEQTDAMLDSIMNALFRRTDESKEHIETLKALAEPLKSHFELNHENRKDLDLLIELHDIGKVSLESDIFKRERLSEEERNEIKRHPEVGYRIANALPRLKSVAYAILTHHENVDGSGYPFGLTKLDIPFIARLFRVIDSYDAMRRDCGYSPAKTKNAALKELRKYAGSHYDADIVDAFSSALEKKA
ncbi:MAG: HD domain-containing phosphohydrolase [Bacillota bacterium]